MSVSSFATRLATVLLCSSLALAPSAARADYVGSLTNRILLDAESIPVLLDGYDDGDEVAYILETQPRDTGSDFGIAAWATVYIPPGVEVIGADYVKPGIGGTWVVTPEPTADDSYDGWGSRGSKNYKPDVTGTGDLELEDGRVAQVNQDIGIFYSTDPRTQGQLAQILPALTPTGPETKPAKIFNQWDYDQVKAFGTNSALSGNKGTGNSPLVSVDQGATWKGTGSAVAGPDTYYTNDYNPACNGTATCDDTKFTTAQCTFAADAQCVGPWQRIHTPQGRIGGSGAVLPATSTGSITNTSVPTSSGYVLDGAHPLPSGTNAVRFVHGARRLGEFEYSRIRFRITDVNAFVASLTADTFCLESTGGDTSKTAAKDVPWRYYEPEHKCFQELGGPGTDAIFLKQAEYVNGAPSGGSFLNGDDVIGWAITVHNVSDTAQANLTITDKADSNVTLIEPGDPLCPWSSYDGDIPGPAYTAGSATGVAKTAAWAVVPTLAPGASFTVHLCGKVSSAAAKGDLVSNTASITMTLADASTLKLTSTATGTVSGGLIDGRVLLDPDKDGDPLDGDSGIAGVTVNLYGDTNGNGKYDVGEPLVDSTTTAADGSYEFTGLDAGDYVVVEEDPASYGSSADRDNAAGTCAAGNGCNAIAVTLVGSASSRGNDFYDYPPCGDGAVDAGEDCDNGASNGTAGNCCAADCKFVPADTECRASAGVCDVAEKCTGSSGDCPADGFEPASTVCRGAAGDCDVAENCTGSDAACPANGFAAASTPCGDASDTICDNADTCDGSGACQPNPEPGTTVCRAAAGDCDVAENCDGAGSCPADAFAPEKTPCGDQSDTVCDNPDRCDANGACQDDAEPNTTVCRAASGECDLAENCDGAGDCPADSFVAASTPCGDASDTVCDNADTCDGSGACQPNPEPGTTVCRAATGDCDVAENCDGAGSCPADEFAPEKTPCGDQSDTVCDNPDRCDANGACQDDAEPSTTECRASTGECDIAENCDGAGNCPADSFVAASTPCGDASDTICDNADACDGSGTCQPNPEPNTTVCRSAVDACDAAETCDGAGSCPPDGFAPSSTPCGDTSDTACDNPDTCDGAGICLANEDPDSPSCIIADLSIGKVDLTGPVQAGAFTTYEITVENKGPDAAANVVVTDTLDPNTTYAASSLPCVEGPVGKLTCTLGAMAAGEVRSFHVVVYVKTTAPTDSTLTGPECPGDEDVCNRVTVTSSTPDVDLSNNDAEVATDVIVATWFSHLVLVKSDLTAEPVEPGANVTYEVVVTNNGPDTATDVVIYDSLDPFMTYVSDNVGCTVTSPGSPLGAQLACPMGDIVAGGSKTLSVVVNVALNVPIGSTLRDGDCDKTEDVCNLAVVGTSASDDVFDDNLDDEPTDMSPAPLCGNGRLNPGETCDPPSAEICNDTIDNDGDQVIDCEDPDCLVPGFQSCDANCQLTEVCKPILDDPARMTKRFLRMHGRYIPDSPVDPGLEGFVFLLTNEDGEIYRGRLLPGDMKRLGDPGPGLKRWLFKDASAQRGAGMRDGIFRAEVKERPERDGTVSYPFRIRVYGDFRTTPRARMTTQVYLGGDVGHLTAEWRGKNGHWTLTKKAADAGRR